MSAEVVFSLAVTQSAQPARVDVEPGGLFHYSNGPVKVPGPWKRGRPRGSANKVPKSRDSRYQSQSTFEFINTSERSRDITSEARARIRRHAKQCQTRKERKPQKVTTDHLCLALSTTKQVPKQDPQALANFNIHQILGVDPFDQSPIKLEPYMHDLLVFYTDTVWKNFYTLEHLAGYNPITDYWLFLAFQDPALIHIFIGCADVYSRGYGAIMSGTKGLKHFYEAVSLVNQRLQDAHNHVSGTTLSTIAALAMLEKGAGRHENWQIHMKGLKLLVNQRGGLGTLSSNPFVLNKIYRADLYGALDDTESPYFEGPPMSHARLSSQQPFHSKGLNDFLEIVNLDQNLADCIRQLEDAMILWDDTNSPVLAAQTASSRALIKKHTSSQVARTRQLLTEVQYTLLLDEIRQRSSDYTQRDELSEYLRVILILYTITILHEPMPSKFMDRRIGAVFRRIYTQLVTQNTDFTLQSTPSLWVSAISLDFHIWSMFLAISVTNMIPDSETRSWLMMSFFELTSSDYGNIHDWDDLRSRLHRYLWISNIHDQSSWVLWCEVVKMREENCPQSR